MNYLPGVPREYVEGRLRVAGGDEIASGKLSSLESSSALAVNCFAWFHTCPQLLPPFPGVSATYPAHAVDVEFEARFPWAGGTHPWLDAFIVTESEIIGVESKRFEPFRGKTVAAFSEAYDRPVWGNDMAPYESLRDALRTKTVRYQHLGAAQLVKHAFGLVTQAARAAKPAILVYLFAEPHMLNGRPISASAHARHREEVADFGGRVSGAAVRFCALSYREWMWTWSNHTPSVAQHGHAILQTFHP